MTLTIATSPSPGAATVTALHAPHQPRQPHVRTMLRIAYLTTEYPKVSHTFIRREIVELERLGYSITRLAIRSSGGVIADDADRREQQRTEHCLNQPWPRHLLNTLMMAIGHPLRMGAAIGAALRMSGRSDRGVLRHLAYVVEAVWLCDRLHRAGINHVHVHFGTNAATVALLANRLSGVSFSLTIHGPDEFDQPRGFALAEKVAAARFVVAISDFCAAQVRRWADPQHWHKIHVVRCSVDAQFLDEPTPIDCSGTRTLLCIGRLSAQKGQLLLIDAAAALHREGEQFQLILAGDGEMREVIAQRIRQHHMEHIITITGWVDESAIRSLLRRCCALVQPSFAEGLPVVMMEALAMSRPVIATCIAGIPELIEHRRNGWLVPAGNADALAHAMREALHADAAELNRMGSEGRQAVQRRHFAPAEAAALADVLERTAGGTG